MCVFVYIKDTFIVRGICACNGMSTQELEVSFPVWVDIPVLALMELVC